MKFLFVLALCIVALIPVTVLAQAITDLGVAPFGSVIAQFYDISLKVVGLAVFVMFLIAGLSYILPDSLKPGFMKNPGQIIRDAVIGAILLFSAAVILNTLNPALTQLQGAAPSPQTQPTVATAPASTPDPVLCASAQRDYSLTQTYCVNGVQMGCDAADAVREFADLEGCTLTEPPAVTNKCAFFDENLAEYQLRCDVGDQHDCDILDIILTYGETYSCGGL